MKKLFVLFLLLCAVPAFAAQDINEIIDGTLSYASPAIEADRNIAGADRVTFFATISNSATTAAVTATVTAAMSIDGTNWQDVSWFDVAGGGIPQTSEITTGVKQTYIGWTSKGISAKFIRIRVNATNFANAKTYTPKTATLTVNVVEKK